MLIAPPNPSLDRLSAWFSLYNGISSPFESSWCSPRRTVSDVELVIPELVETVDAQTGARIPLEVIRYGSRQVPPGLVHPSPQSGASAYASARADFEGEPGRFRFWTAPGAAYVSTLNIPSGLAMLRARLDEDFTDPDGRGGRAAWSFALPPHGTLAASVTNGELPPDVEYLVLLVDPLDCSEPVRLEDWLPFREDAVGPFTLETDLLPGTYRISLLSAPEPEGEELTLAVLLPERSVTVEAGETVTFSPER